MSKKEETLYTFKTKEFDHFEKTPAWYVNMAILFLGIAAIFIFVLHQYLASLVVIAGLVALYAHSSQEPKKVKVKITNKKIKIGRHKHPFKKLKSFWLVDQGHQHKLYLYTSTLLFPVISIPLGGGEPKKIKQALGDYLPEAQSGETVNDKLTRWLRF